MPELVERISAELNVPEDGLRSALEQAFTRYKKFSIPKRSGGKRTIIQPSAEIKLIQQWLSRHLFVLLPVNPIASAYTLGSSILRNAAVHANSLYGVRVDFSDFFNSISFEDLKLYVTSVWAANPTFLISDDLWHLIRRACFDRAGFLPVGYPTSPTISNMVMHSLDSRTVALVNSAPETFGKCALTRYADDVIFSTNKRGACLQFVRMFSELVAEHNSPCLRINDSKTKYMSRAGGSMFVTGLRIRADGYPTLHRAYKDHVRLMLSLLNKDRLPMSEFASLIGHLSYISSVDGAFLTKLAFKYSIDTVSLRAKLYGADQMPAASGG